MTRIDLPEGEGREPLWALRPFYAGIADSASRGRYPEREALAIEFADRFVAGAAAFDEEFWERMRARSATRRSST